MKTIKNSLAVLLALFFVAATTDMSAQGRKRGNGNDNNRDQGQKKEYRGNSEKDHNNPRQRFDKKDHDRSDNRDNKHRDYSDNRDNRHRDYSDNRDNRDREPRNRYSDNRERHHYHDKDGIREVKYYDRHYRKTIVYRRPVRWVSVQHRHIHPRYVYYRDYNVYYDCRRDVFIWWSDRGWVISTTLPFILHRVDLVNAVTMGVDYYDDDFTYYMARKRPAYFSIRVGF